MIRVRGRVVAFLQCAMQVGRNSAISCVDLVLSFLLERVIILYAQVLNVQCSALYLLSRLVGINTDRRHALHTI